MKHLSAFLFAAIDSAVLDIFGGVCYTIIKADG